MTLDCVVERVSEVGRNNLESLQQQVVRSSLNNLTILVREFAQNSWDARRKGLDPLFSVDGIHLTRDQSEILAEHVFAGHATAGTPALSKWLKSRRRNQLNALVISDWNTIGLGGNLDPRVAEGDDRSHWTAYLHDLGVGQEGPNKGGRYGVGRTSSFSVSEVSAIVVYTRALLVDGSKESRLIAVALGGKKRQDNQRLTGRVWWGKETGRSGARFALPLVGKAADKLAEDIGISARGSDDTGLSVMILNPILVDPDFDDSADMRSALEMISWSIVWNLWPKFVSRRASSMCFQVSYNGEEISIPDPEVHPVLKGFVKTAGEIRRRKGKVIKVVDSGPVVVRQIHWKDKIVGHLALSAEVLVDEKLEAFERINRVGGVVKPHHVMLMRQPELVVQYLEMRSPSLPYTGVFGVFIPLDEFDPIFALAEPPAHDRWSIDQIDEGLRNERSIVRVSITRIKEAYDVFVQELEGYKPPSHGSEILDESSRKISDLLLAQRPRTVRKTGSSTNSDRESKIGKLRFTDAIPSVRDGLGYTLLRGRWTPGILPASNLTLRFTISPTNQRSNEVQMKDHPSILLDPLLAFDRVTSEGGVSQINGLVATIQLDHPDKHSDIEVLILRQRELGVDVRVEVDSARIQEESL